MITETESSRDAAALFTPMALNNMVIRNRIFRSATYEGMGDSCGFPRPELATLYTNLARGGVGAIITGFVYVSQAGRAMHAGFDGVQIHAAHGYLAHQFLSPWTNTRSDAWCDRALFLEELIRAVRKTCGNCFPILVKLSTSDDNSPGIRVEDTISTINRIVKLGVAAIEISYGTMEYALNIIRGDCPVDLVLKTNPFFNKIPAAFRKAWKLLRANKYASQFMPFEENHNVDAASIIAAATSVPVIVVGGIRSREAMIDCVTKHGLAGVALSRPLIREPDLPLKLKNGIAKRSRCTNCNYCTILCDSPRSIQCYCGGKGD